MNKKMKLVIELAIDHDNLDDVVDQLKDFAKLVKENTEIFHSALDESSDKISIGGVVKHRESDKITGTFSLVHGEVDVKFDSVEAGLEATPFGDINDVITALEKAAQ